jgi:hypothetical protein
MPARLISLRTAIAAFFGLKPNKQEPDMEQLFVDAYNKSKASWVEKGWIEKPR